MEMGSAVKYNPGIHMQALGETTVSSVRITGHSAKIQTSTS